MSRFDNLKDRDLAIDPLASYLNQGNVTLFLGAGVSYDFGLPGWFELVNRLREKHSLSKLQEYASTEDLQSAVDEVKDQLGGSEQKLIESTRVELYSDITRINIQSLLKNPLLMAIAALMMGSRRGRVRRVITLNYDNLLQWTLSTFGFNVQTVHRLPAMETNADVIIYHPHGFLPISGSMEDCSEFIIFGKESVNLRLGSTNDQWFEMIRHVLNSSICLFIGLNPKSLSDPAISPLLNTIGKNVYSERPLGSWIIKSDANKPLSQAKLAEFQRCNIYPISLESPEEISVFLFEVCKKAGEYIKKYP